MGARIGSRYLACKPMSDARQYEIQLAFDTEKEARDYCDSMSEAHEGEWCVIHEVRQIVNRKS